MGLGLLGTINRVRLLLELGTIIRIRARFPFGLGFVMVGYLQ